MIDRSYIAPSAPGDPGALGSACGLRRPFRLEILKRVSRFRPLDLFVGTTIPIGLAVIAAFLVFGDLEPSVSQVPGSLHFWLFAVAVAIGELFPITVPRGGVVEEITPSTTFAFALLLGWGPGEAVLTLAAASLVADVVRGKPLYRVLFNVSQYAISLGAAGVVYFVLGGGSLTGGDWTFSSFASVIPFVASATTFFMINDLLPAIAITLSGGIPLFHHIRRNIGFNAGVAVALLAMAPVVIVLANHNPLLLPALAFPVASVHIGAKATLRNFHLMETKNQELAELNQLKDDFVAMVSHELRTPLTSIQGGVKTLLQLGKEIPWDDRKSLLEAADRQSDRLRQLIERLLLVAQVDRPKGTGVVSRVSLRSLAAYVVFELQDRAADRPLRFEFAPDDLEASVEEGNVHQILSNLVENALKYSDRDGPITIRGYDEGNSVVLSVEDSGPGIPEESRGRVFDRFYQVDQSRTRSVGGTGLGLYISRVLAREMGGDLFLDESYEQGCRFVLRIPCQRTDSDERPSETPTVLVSR